MRPAHPQYAFGLRAETFTQLQQVALGSISPTQAAENLDSKLKTLS